MAELSAPHRLPEEPPELPDPEPPDHEPEEEPPDRLPGEEEPPIREPNPERIPPVKEPPPRRARATFHAGRSSLRRSMG